MIIVIHIYLFKEPKQWIINTAAADADANNSNKKVISKSCAPFSHCKSEVDSFEIDNAKDIDIA